MGGAAGAAEQCDRIAAAAAAPAGPRVRAGRGGAVFVPPLPGPGGAMKKPDGKVVLLGDMNVGKTSLLHRYMERRFQDTVSTVGGAFYLKQWGPYNISIWDTAGGPRGCVGGLGFLCARLGLAEAARAGAEPRCPPGTVPQRSLMRSAAPPCSVCFSGTLGREILLLCHFVSRSSPTWLFLCQELRRRKRGSETAEELRGDFLEGEEETCGRSGCFGFTFCIS